MWEGCEGDEGAGEALVPAQAVARGRFIPPDPNGVVLELLTTTSPPTSVAGTRRLYPPQAIPLAMFSVPSLVYTALL